MGHPGCGALEFAEAWLGEEGFWTYMLRMSRYMG